MYARERSGVWVLSCTSCRISCNICCNTIRSAATSAATRFDQLQHLLQHDSICCNICCNTIRSAATSAATRFEHAPHVQTFRPHLQLSLRNSSIAIEHVPYTREQLPLREVRGAPIATISRSLLDHTSDSTDPSIHPSLHPRRRLGSSNLNPLFPQSPIPYTLNPQSLNL